MALTAGHYATDTRTKLNRNQVKGFWAAWGGWTLDGTDSFIYALVAVPALMELLPQSGIAATPRNVGFYFSGLQALFLLGYLVFPKPQQLALCFAWVRDPPWRTASPWSSDCPLSLRN